MFLPKIFQAATPVRTRMYMYAAVLMLVIALTDWTLVPHLSMGILYIVPVLLIALTRGKFRVVIVSAVCAVLWEVANPFHQEPGSGARTIVGFGGFALMGLFVSELNRNHELEVTHLKEQEWQNKLRLDAETQLRVLIDTSPLAILTTNQDGIIQLANRSARQLFDLGEDSVQPVDAREFLPILARLLKGQDGNLRTTVECPGRRSNGEVFLAHIWVSTFMTSGGIGLAVVVWYASDNLRDREGADLDSMLSTSRTLIGAVAHEVRNLAAAGMSAYQELAVDHNLDSSDQYRALGAIIQGLQRVAASGLRMASKRTAVFADIVTVLDQARIVIEPAAREAGCSIEWSIAPDLPRVQADHHSLLQVFLNLARNSERALDASPEKQISVDARMEGDMVVVRFRDTGTGVQDPSQLFRPFQSGGASQGLGLFISRAILRADGGDLRFEPQPSGACFVLELWPVEDPAS